MIYIDLMSYEMVNEIFKNLLALHVFTFLTVWIPITLYIVVIWEVKKHSSTIIDNVGMLIQEPQLTMGLYKFPDTFDIVAVLIPEPQWPLMLR